MRESQRAAIVSPAGAKETSGRSPASPRTRAVLALILAVALAASVTGLDWGLPYQWHTDEKVTQAINVLHSPRWDPDYFINPHAHIYLVAAAFKIAYLIYPGHDVAQALPDIVPMVSQDSPARRLQLLAMRLSRGISVVFGLCTVLAAFVIGRRHWDEPTGLLAAAFTAVTMGLVNLWHFATPESLLILMILLTLAALDRVIIRGTGRAYVVAGACLGLACSTKYTAVALGAPFLAAHLAGRRSGFASGRSIALLVEAAGAALLTFVLGTPLLIADWKQFWEFGVVYNWYTGAPTGSLLAQKRSYGPYLGLLGNALGWPLFALTLAGLVFALVQLARGRGDAPSRRAYLVHITWILPFYGFYGLSPHHALRFIVPIAPSLVLLGASAAMAFVRQCGTASRRQLASAAVAGVLLYSAVYTGRADEMFLRDTRYAAGAWLGRSLKGPSARLDFFSIEAYLPYFDRPAFGLRFVPFVEQVTLHHADFWNRARAYLDESPAPIVDSNFYYDRYLDDPARFPERVDFYRHLLTGTDPAGFKPVARFTFENPRWLNPRPERVAPDVVVFAKEEIR